MLSIGRAISGIFMGCNEIFTFESNRYEFAVRYDISEGGKIQSCSTTEKWNSQLLAQGAFNLINKPFDGLFLRNNNAPLPH